MTPREEAVLTVASDPSLVDLVIALQQVFNPATVVRNEAQRETEDRLARVIARRRFEDATPTGPLH